MKYRIKRIVSREKTRERIILFACLLIYFLCFILSEVYENHIFPQWLFEAYKKLPK